MDETTRRIQELRAMSNQSGQENKANQGVRVSLIDGCELVRRGLWHTLEAVEGMKIVGDYSNAEEALFEMTRIRSDMVLIGTQLPGMSWLEATRSLKKNKQYSGVEVIVLAESAVYRNEALEAGAAQCLLKDVTSEELIRVIRQVYRDRCSVKARDVFAEEVVELIIPPSVDNNRQLRFMCQLAEILRDSFASIICTVGSWDSGTVITVRPYSMEQASIVMLLAHMPEVERVEEEMVTMSALPHLYRRTRFLPRLGIRPVQRLRVTLKEDSLVGQEVGAGLT